MTEFEIFAAAQKIGDAAARLTFLDQACAGHAALRAGVDALLKADGLPCPFLDGESIQNSPVHPLTETFIPEDATSLARTIVGKYKLLQQIGEGGMGTVYMAEQLAPIRRKVAVKLIKEGRDSKSILARFSAEQQAIALMDHPNIARLLDAGTTDRNEPFFVMELIHGKPIATYCDDNRLTLPQRIALFIPVCHAIEHAHHKGIIHRDIKSTNILVAQYDGVPIAKVIDFGLVKAIGQQLTDHTSPSLFGAVVGTPGYMSPEQATSNQLDVDARSDIYSLAAVLYELLTGSTPHPAAELKERAILEVLRIIREDEPARASQRLSSSNTLPSLAATRRIDPQKLVRFLKGELDLVVMKALERDRSRRYQHPNDLADDLQRFLNREPVHAAPPSFGYRFQKYIVKRWKPVLVAAALLLTAATGAGAVLWQQYQGRERDRMAELNDFRAKEADRKRELAESRSAIVLANQEAVEREAAAEKREAAASQYFGLLGKIAKEEQQRLAGWRNRSLELVKQAATQETASRNWIELRSIATRIAIAPDVNPSPDWTFKHPNIRQIGGPLAFSRSGKLIAVALASNVLAPNPTVVVLDAETGKTIHRLVAQESKLPFGFGSKELGAPRISAYSVCFGPEDATVFVGTREGTLYRWSLGTKPQFRKAEVGTGGVVCHCTPDGRFVVTHVFAEDDYRIRCWDANSLSLVAERTNLKGITESISIAPDSQTLAGGTRILTIPDLKSLQDTPLLGEVTHVPTSGELLSVGNGRLNLHAGNRREIKAVFSLSNSNVSQALRLPCVTRRGDRIACLNGTLNQVVFWGADDFRPSTVLLPADQLTIHHISLCPNGDRVAIVTDGVLSMHGLLPVSGLATVQKLGGGFRGVSVSPDGSELSIRIQNQVLRRFRLMGDMLDAIGDVTVGSSQLARDAISYSPDGRWIVTGGSFKSPTTDVAIIDRRGAKSNRIVSLRGERHFTLNKFKPNYLVDYQWTQSGYLVVAAHTRLYVWDLEPDVPLLLGSLSQPEPINTSGYVGFWMRGNDGWALTEDNHFYRIQFKDKGLSFVGRSRLHDKGTATVASSHAESPFLLAGDDRGDVRLVNHHDGRVVAIETGHHQSPVTAIAWYQPNRVVTAARDGVLCFWKVADQSLTEEFRLDLMTTATSLSATPDGSLLYAATHSGERLTTLHLPSIESLHQELGLLKDHIPAMHQAPSPRVPSLPRSVTLPGDRDQLLPETISYTAEREAAEWVLSVGGQVTLQDRRGDPLALLDGNLPNEFFVLDRADLNTPAQFSSDQGLDKLAACQRISRLTLKEIPKLTNEGMSKLRLARIRDLTIDNCPQLTDEALSSISTMRELRSLDLQRLRFTDAGVSALSAARSLRRISLSSTSITDVGLQKLGAGCPGITHAVLWAAVDPGKQTVEGVRNYANLTYLEITGDQLTEEAVTILNAIPSNKWLYLFPPIDDATVKHLHELKHVEILGIHSHINETAATLSPTIYSNIEWPAQLVHLGFVGGSVSPRDEDLLVISKLPHLKVLGVSFDSNHRHLQRYSYSGFIRFREQRPDVALSIGPYAYSIDEPLPPTDPLDQPSGLK